MRHFRQSGALVVTVILSCLIQPTLLAGQESLRPELGQLVNQEDEAFLLSAIHQIHPPTILRRLTDLQKGRDIAGGGICGLEPTQSVAFDVFPLAADQSNEGEAAVALAQQRHNNLRTLTARGFPVEFSPSQPPLPTPWPPASMSLTIDWSVPAAFLTALEDGVVTAEETAHIVRLPANMELLQYYASHEELLECPLTEQDLVFFVTRSASPDPFDRLFCWLNPMHYLGYADLVSNAFEYRRVLNELQTHSDAISDAVLTRIAPFLAPDSNIQTVLSLSVCCPMSTWTTPQMVGVNVEHLKGDWEHIVRVLTAAVFDRVQQQLRHSAIEPEPLTMDDLMGNRSAGSQYQSLERAITTAVSRGSADYVADLGSSDDERYSVELGAALLHRCAAVDRTPETSAPIVSLPLEEEIVSCSLCSLGRYLTRIITAYDGPQAISELIQRGPAEFFLRAADIESGHGRNLLSHETICAIRELARNR